MNIAFQAVISILEEGEIVEADWGYAGKEYYIKIPKDAKTNEHRHIKMVTRSRHELANNRLKVFRMLESQFCHGLEKHSMCFRAVVVITQLNIEYDHSLYKVDYTNF